MKAKECSVVAWFISAGFCALVFLCAIQASGDFSKKIIVIAPSSIFAVASIIIGLRNRAVNKINFDKGGRKKVKIKHHDLHLPR